jgi:hypothetical protein
MHEIIETFEQDDRKSDMAYAYLMVFGLFFGNFAGCEYTEGNKEQVIRRWLTIQLFRLDQLFRSVSC